MPPLAACLPRLQKEWRQQGRAPGGVLTRSMRAKLERHRKVGGWPGVGARGEGATNAGALGNGAAKAAIHSHQPNAATVLLARCMHAF